MVSKQLSVTWKTFLQLTGVIRQVCTVPAVSKSRTSSTYHLTCHHSAWLWSHSLNKENFHSSSSPKLRLFHTSLSERVFDAVSLQIHLDSERFAMTLLQMCFVPIDSIFLSIILAYFNFWVSSSNLLSGFWNEKSSMNKSDNEFCVHQKRSSAPRECFTVHSCCKVTVSFQLRGLLKFYPLISAWVLFACVAGSKCM